MKSAKGIRQWLRTRGRSRNDMAFLPAALEIVETPASPIGRAISATIVVGVCLALVWAYFGEIDIVASAAGKIIPSGRTKIIQPLEIGVVKSIHVSDGQAVKQNDILIELDSTTGAAERSRIQSELIAAKLDMARLQAALADSQDPLAHFVPPQDAPAALVATQIELLKSQSSEHLAKLAALDRQKAQKESELVTILATIDKEEAVIPLIQRRVDVRAALADFGSKLNYYEIVQLLVEHQHDVIVQKGRYREVEAAISTIAETRNQTVSEFRRSLYGELSTATQKADGLAQDLIRADQKIRLLTLTAPIDGVVEQLAIHTVGGVVTPAQSLLTIVPVESRLEIEANVSNQDIGFVRVGQPAEIKIDTFNFTRYGLLSGQVTSISQDAVLRDKPAGKAADTANGTSNASSEPKGQELSYVARVSLDKSSLPVDGKLVTLQPGMAVTVEIKTGSRTVMSYLLSPLLRSRQESLRER